MGGSQERASRLLSVRCLVSGVIGKSGGGGGGGGDLWVWKRGSKCLIDQCHVKVKGFLDNGFFHKVSFSKCGHRGYSTNSNQSNIAPS